MHYDEIIAQNQAWIDETWAKIEKKASAAAVKSRDKIPYTTDANGNHNDMTKNPHMWTNGFWGAYMWLMYEATKNDDFAITARNCEKVMDACFNDMDELHHDVGFMWHIMTGARYALTGEKDARNKDLLCAMTLASRFKLNGGYIRAWNGTWKGEDNNGWTIIDCLMNLPLLFWASREIGDDRFAQIALSHLDMAMEHHIRQDGSVNHIVFHDVETGEMTGTHRGQGYAVGSTWSRGASWAVYGFALAYAHTKDEKYLNIAKRVANDFIANLSVEGWLPLVDFRAPAEPVQYDSTAGAIASCGFLEIAKHCPEHEKKLYLKAALNTLQAMDKSFCRWGDNIDAFLDCGKEEYHFGQSHPIIYGDFFYAEAILKLKGSEFNPWTI